MFGFLSKFTKSYNCFPKMKIFLTKTYTNNYSVTPYIEYNSKPFISFRMYTEEQFSNISYNTYQKIYPKFLKYLKENSPMLLNNYIIWYEKSFEFKSNLVTKENILNHIFDLRQNIITFENLMLNFLHKDLQFNENFIIKNLNGVQYHEK